MRKHPLSFISRDLKFTHEFNTSPEGVGTNFRCSPQGLVCRKLWNSLDGFINWSGKWKYFRKFLESLVLKPATLRSDRFLLCSAIACTIVSFSKFWRRFRISISCLWTNKRKLCGCLFNVLFSNVTIYSHSEERKKLFSDVWKRGP